MTKNEIINIATEAFTLIYREGVDASFRFPMGAAASIMDRYADNILKRENGLVSIGIVVDYCIHHAYLWRDRERFRNFSITWAFGDTGAERFYSAKRGVVYYQDIWLKEIGLDRNDIKLQFSCTGEHPLAKYIYIEAEDGTKSRAHNTAAGYVMCRTLTSGYTPHSPYCSDCAFSAQCREDLRALDHELFRLRTSKK